MPVEFIYDSTEDYSPQKDNFLTPVYFEKEVLIEFIYNPNYNCTFASETYGTLSLEGYYIPFGINSQNHLIFWLGDIKELPDSIQYILKAKNINSDHDIESEFKQSQLHAKFTHEIREVELFLLLNKINKESQKRFNFKIFNFNLISLDELFKICSTYKRITFNNEDDFKRIISDFNERLLEIINKDGIVDYLESKQITIDKKFGGVKSLEIFFKTILSDNSNMIAPFFYLYDLRIWADHSGSQDKFDEVVKILGLKPDSSFNEIYKILIQRLCKTLDWMLNEINLI